MGIRRRTKIKILIWVAVLATFFLMAALSQAGGVRTWSFGPWGPFGPYYIGW